MVNVGKNTTTGNGHTRKQFPQFLIKYRYSYCHEKHFQPIQATKHLGIQEQQPSKQEHWFPHASRTFISSSNTILFG